MKIQKYVSVLLIILLVFLVFLWNSERKEVREHEFRELMGLHTRLLELYYNINQLSETLDMNNGDLSGRELQFFQMAVKHQIADLNRLGTRFNTINIDETGTLVEDIMNIIGDTVTVLSTISDQKADQTMIDNTKKLLSGTSNRMGDLFFTIETGQITTPDFQQKVHDLSEDARKEIKSISKWNYCGSQM